MFLCGFYVNFRWLSHLILISPTQPAITCSKLTIVDNFTPCSYVSVVNFEQVNAGLTSMIVRIMWVSNSVLCRKHFGDEKIVLHLKGIAYMNDDPGEVYILYAKVKLHNQNDTRYVYRSFQKRPLSVDLFNHVLPQALTLEINIFAVPQNIKWRYLKAWT